MAQTIAYIVSRFPKISETFILDEILELQRRGLNIEIFSLLEEKETKIHCEAERLRSKVHYARIVGADFLLAQFYWLSHSPFLYVRSWQKALCGNLSSFRFLLRALVVVPVAAYFALLMKQRKIQHIHAHWATHPALAAYVIRELTGLPYSITAHAHDIYVDRSMLPQKLAAASFVVTISDYNRKLLAGYGDAIAQKIRTIHCGINPNIFQRRPGQNHTATPFNILCVASLNDYKGHRYLLQACATLKLQGIPFQCLLAGDGPERKRIESQILHLGLQKEVTLLAWQTREEIGELMRLCDVVVLPSIVTASGKQEGIPVALMEAMAMEIPVVATKISGLSELVEHGKSGLLVEEKNADALAIALKQIYNDRDAAIQMGSAGRARVLQEFSLQANAERLHQLFSNETVVETNTIPQRFSELRTEEKPC